MPILPLTFHYGGVFFQSYCKKPKLKKREIKRVYATCRNDNLRGSQESLVSTGDGSESNTTEISSEQSVVSTETSGIASEASAGTDGDAVMDRDKTMKGETTTADKSEEKPKEGEDKDIDQPDVRDLSKKRDLTANEIIAEMEKRQRESHRTNLSKAKLCVMVLLLVNIPGAMYLSLIHQRGTLNVMKFIHDASLKHTVDVLFLMPCHSTPYYRSVLTLTSVV